MVQLLLRAILVATLSLVPLSLGEAVAKATSIKFGTNWLAQAEHGGFYQAVADGTYKKFDLDVEIVPGGPMRDNRLKLLSGALDFYMGGNITESILSVEQDVPLIAVAAIFQKEPQVLMSHPNAGFDTFQDLKKSNSVIISAAGTSVFYQWLIKRYGFSFEQTKPYNFDSTQFMADPASVQQAYLTSQPFEIERKGGFKPNVFLLADYGFNDYSTTIVTTRDTLQNRSDIVQRFVDASIIGWMNYLYGDNRAANDLIKRDNPDMTDEQLAYSLQKLKEYGIVDSGDAVTNGVGAIDDKRVEAFFEELVKTGLVDAKTDFRKAYTTAFVNKKIGAELRK